MKFLVVFLAALFAPNLLVESIKLNCNFINHDSKIYACYAKNFEIISKYDRVITEVTGDHHSGKTNEDVKFFYSRDNLINYYQCEVVPTFHPDHIFAAANFRPQICGDVIIFIRIHIFAAANLWTRLFFLRSHKFAAEFLWRRI